MQTDKLWIRILCLLLAALMIGGVAYYAISALLL